MNIFWILGNLVEKIILKKLHALNLKAFILPAWGYGRVMVKS